MRQQLLSENKTGKYLKYAIGEIVLVMIGILLALQINNWNEARSQKDQLHQYLATLVKELNNDKEKLMSSKNVNSFRVHSMQRLLQFSGISPFDFGGYVVMGVIPYQDNGIWKGPLPDSINISFIEAAISRVGKNND